MLPRKTTAPAPTIVIIGGGIAGLMSAFHIKQEQPKSRIMVLEQGNFIPYAYSTSTRSAACSRQQWGCKHNVQMSLYSTRFYENFEKLVGEKDRMFWQRGYLFLYRDAGEWSKAKERVQKQRSWGLNDVRYMEANELKQEFPFSWTPTTLGATFCPTDGFLDPGIILTALKTKLVSLGVHILTNMEVVGFQTSNGAVTAVQVDGATMPCDFVVNCTGAWASQIGKMLGTNLPVAPEKRYLWSAEFRNPKDDFSPAEYNRIPFMVCNNGNITPYVKPEPVQGRNSFMVGCEHAVEPSWKFKPEDQDWVDPNFRVNIPDGFHQHMWEVLTDWLPFTEKWGFRNRVHAGFYETTPFHSPIIGYDPNHKNLIHCVGFSGHGIMHGPAAGATVADLIACGQYCRFPSGTQNLSWHSLENGTREVENMKI